MYVLLLLDDSSLPQVLTTSTADDQLRKHFEPIANGTPFLDADETRPLLPTSGKRPSVYSVNQSTTSKDGDFDILPEDETPKRTLILHEFWVLVRGSIPVILAYTLQNSLQTVSILIVGRASPRDLSTAAFSYMFAMCTGWLIGMG